MADKSRPLWAKITRFFIGSFIGIFLLVMLLAAISMLLITTVFVPQQLLTEKYIEMAIQALKKIDVDKLLSGGYTIEELLKGTFVASLILLVGYFFLRDFAVGFKKRINSVMETIEKY
jgi:flagellar biosynthesis protein FlhB